MTYLEYADKLETLKYIVQQKHSGSPVDVAKKLCLSERTVLRMVHQLREHGFPIIYNRSRGSYQIDEDENKN